MKNYRENELKNYIIGCVLAVVIISSKQQIMVMRDKEYYDLIVVLISSGLLSAVLYSFVFVFDSILSFEIKAVISSLSLHLPGERIWSDIDKGKKDKRFSNVEAKEKYQNIIEGLPKDKKERYEYENNHWYSIYSKVQKEKKVELAQKDYLLCRDINCANCIIAIFYLVFSLFFRVLDFSWFVIILLIILYILMVMATRNKGHRFVYTVIATDMQQCNKRKNEDPKYILIVSLNKTKHQ